MLAINRSPIGARLEGNPLRRWGLSLAAAGLVLAASAAPVLANPQGGVVVAGQGAISTPNVNTTILDQNPSQILGSIIANGQVYLLNPNGIVFGKTATVNVGALFATSLNISNSDFMAGKLKFSADAGKDGGVIVNHGVLKAADGGSVNLIGGNVLNDGVIVANLGQVDLVAGHAVTVDFDGDGLMQFEVSGPVLNNMLDADSGAAVTNNGSITANGGSVLMSANTAQQVFAQAVNNGGVVQ